MPGYLNVKALMTSVSWFFLWFSGCLDCIMQNDVFPYTFLAQLWILSSQDLKLLRLFLEHSFVLGMLPKSIGWLTIFWAWLSVSRSGVMQSTDYKLIALSYLSSVEYPLGNFMLLHYINSHFFHINQAVYWKILLITS